MRVIASTSRSADIYRVPQVNTNSRGAEPAISEQASLIFVTGASRSGTTMLARMLGAHSEIAAFNEMHFFGSLWDPYDTSRQYSESDLAKLAATLLARHTSGLWGGQPTEVEHAWGERLVRDLTSPDRTAPGLFAAALSRLAADSGKRFACEKTPRNIFYARRLLALYPNARILHIIRDPRAVMASQKNRWQVKKLGAVHAPWSELLRIRVNYHPVTMAKLWSNATQAALELVGHPRFSIVRFEDLAADPKAGAQHICSLMGLSFEPGMLAVPRWGSSHVTHTSELKGVSAEVVDKWRDSLSSGEGLICERVTHGLMRHFGYPLEYLGRFGNFSTVPHLLSYPLHVAGVLAFNPRRAWIQIRAMSRLQHKDQSGCIDPQTLGTSQHVENVR